MSKKISFIKFIQFWGVIILVVISGSIITLDIFSSYQDFNSRMNEMRTDYISRQKQIIKREVESVANMIKYEKSQSETLIKSKIIKRVYEAYLITQNIYNQNKNNKSKTEIQKLIVDVLSPIRFSQKKGYYFISCLDGIAVLFPSKPELVGKNLINMQDSHKHYVTKDMFKITNESGEGFYEYCWTKPNVEGDGFKKISFIKRFSPYNWIIGAGLYVDDIEEQIKSDLLSKISAVRYGKEGYIFVNSLNGDALISNGELFDGTKKLWERFNKNPEKIKDIFEKEYKAALKPDGDYIYYSWEKLTDSKIESPKTSFIYGIPDFKWLIGAGVYLDDVEKDISLMHTKLNDQVKSKLFYSILIIIGIVLLFLFLFHLLTCKLKNDFNLFISFFNKAVHSKEEISRDLIQFSELDQMAKNANEMLKEKINAQQNLLSEKERYRDLFNKNPLSLWEEDFSKAIKILDEIKSKGTTISKEYFDNNPKIFKKCISAIKILNFNKVTLDLLKYKNKKELLKNFSSIFNENSLITFKKEFVSLANNEKSFSEESELISSDGKIIPVMIQVRVSENYKKAIVSIADTTKLKKAEEELQKMNKLKSIGNLAGGIAHDFNNILMGLFGNIYIAKMELSKEHPSFKHLEEAEKSMNRATRLTKQLLTFAKGGEPIKENISVGQLAKEVINFDLSGSNVKLVFKEVENLWMAEVDGGQMQQVFSNLTINANQAMPDGGHLFITFENADVSAGLLPKLKSGKYIKVIVQDEGIGIDEKYLDRIFDPYFSTKQTGCGLGLATVYSIINKHGGFISVDSKQNKGAIFTLYLPASKMQQLSGKPKSAAKPVITNQKAKILVMDDEEMILKVTSKMLKTIGFSVETAIDGEKTIKMYKKSMDEGKPFDIVIMDLTIPGGMGGEEAIKKLLEIDPQAKAVVSSGYAEDQIVANFAKNGFKGIVSKPYNMNQLRNVLGNILRK